MENLGVRFGVGKARRPRRVNLLVFVHGCAGADGRDARASCQIAERNTFGKNRWRVLRKTAPACRRPSARSSRFLTLPGRHAWIALTAGSIPRSLASSARSATLDAHIASSDCRRRSVETSQSMENLRWNVGGGATPHRCMSRPQVFWSRDARRRLAVFQLGARRHRCQPRHGARSQRGVRATSCTARRARRECGVEDLPSGRAAPFALQDGAGACSRHAVDDSLSSRATLRRAPAPSASATAPNRTTTTRSSPDFPWPLKPARTLVVEPSPDDPEPPLDNAETVSPDVAAVLRESSPPEAPVQQMLIDIDQPGARFHPMARRLRRLVAGRSERPVRAAFSRTQHGGNYASDARHRAHRVSAITGFHEIATSPPVDP
jgi:hypothetical protein